MKKNTIQSLMIELGVSDAVAAGMTLVHSQARVYILETPVAIGKRTARRLGASYYMIRKRPLGKELIPVKLSLHPGLFTPGLRDELIDTFLHEVAHFIAEVRWLQLRPLGRRRRAGHGPVWEHVMLTMGRPPKRCADPEVALRMASFAPAPKEVARCEKCSHTWYGLRRQTKYDRRYYTHNDCGGRIRSVR